MKKFLALSLSDVVFIMLVNDKMPTIVGILTFMSRINFVHKKSFVTSGPDLDCLLKIKSIFRDRNTFERKFDRKPLKYKMDNIPYLFYQYVWNN